MSQNCFMKFFDNGNVITNIDNNSKIDNNICLKKQKIQSVGLFRYSHIFTKFIGNRNAITYIDNFVYLITEITIEVSVAIFAHCSSQNSFLRNSSVTG